MKYKNWDEKKIFSKKISLFGKKVQKCPFGRAPIYTTHITAGQLTAPVLISMFPQFSRAAIYNKINHFKKFGSHSRQPGSGRPNKLFGNDLKSLCKLVENSSQISAKRLSEKLESRGRVKVSERTIQRALKASGYKKKKAK